MTPEQAEAVFSAAYDQQLDAQTQREFDAALAAEPQLAQKYAAFCETLDAVKGLHPTDDELGAPAPDLLSGVQQRLRDKSAGRFYADRFAERSGWGARRLIGVLALIALSLALIWAAFALSSGARLTP